MDWINAQRIVSGGQHMYDAYWSAFDNVHIDVGEILRENICERLPNLDIEPSIQMPRYTWPHI